MKYELVKSSTKDIERIINYKKKTIFKYAYNLDKEEIDKINNYINNNVPKQINSYFNIIVNKNIIGSLLLTNTKGGILLEEIYIEDDYRNKGIGSNIIKNIINNNIVYLWVYKLNNKAISLYKRLGFIIIKETDTRYYMKYSN